MIESNQPHCSYNLLHNMQTVFHTVRIINNLFEIPNPFYRRSLRSWDVKLGQNNALHESYLIRNVVLCAYQTNFGNIFRFSCCC